MSNITEKAATEKAVSIISILRQMLSCCQNIQMLLSQDQGHLRKNALKKMDESNKQKSRLLNELHASIAAFESFNNRPWNEENAELITELHSEILVCYKHIMTNSRVVFANLEQIQMTRDQIASQGSAGARIYDVKGALT